jgi:hypothetical protein
MLSPGGEGCQEFMRTVQSNADLVAQGRMQASKKIRIRTLSAKDENHSNGLFFF